MTNNNQDVVKLYAAFRSGCLGENILDVYFPFFANILIENNVNVVDENELKNKFEQKYDIPVLVNFVRQVLGVGVINGSIANVKGRYEVVQDKISEHKVDTSSFDPSWKELIERFSSFCSENNYSIDDVETENNILRYINSHDLGIVVNRDAYSSESTTSFDYAWNQYLKEIANSKSTLYDFVTTISFSNILMQAIFYAESTKDDFKGLCVYLDSSLIFSLLGMDEDVRVDAVRFLIKEMQNVGCDVLIFDNNLNEVSGIISRAGYWATSPEYDIAKANNAAKYFHDNQYDTQSISEYCTLLESKLSEYGISKKETAYDVLENEFQEDEKLLYEMVEKKYSDVGLEILDEKKRSIEIDVRSIVMLYRIRQGVVSQTVQASRHIMVTQNGAIANVCKNYESNKSTNSGHIPVCISADFFGTILWMFHPGKMLEYRRKQLLADCYSILKPSKKMLKKYVESLDLAKSAGEIDEKKYLFMRSHTVVFDALMNVTKGDYARFNERTYLEVYDEIVASSDKKYADEAAAHAETKRKLVGQETEAGTLNNRIKELEIKEQKSFDNICKIKSILWIICGFGIPYILLFAIFEILKSKFTDFSIAALWGVGGIVLAGIILDSILKKVVYSWVSKKVQKHEEKKREKTDS